MKTNVKCLIFAGSLLLFPAIFGCGKQQNETDVNNDVNVTAAVTAAVTEEVKPSETPVLVTATATPTPTTALSDAELDKETEVLIPYALAGNIDDEGIRKLITEKGWKSVKKDSAGNLNAVMTVRQRNEFIEEQRADYVTRFKTIGKESGYSQIVSAEIKPDLSAFTVLTTEDKVTSQCMEVLYLAITCLQMDSALKNEWTGCVLSVVNSESGKVLYSFDSNGKSMDAIYTDLLNIDYDMASCSEEQRKNLFVETDIIKIEPSSEKQTLLYEDDRYKLVLYPMNSHVGTGYATVIEINNNTDEELVFIPAYSSINGLVSTTSFYGMKIAAHNKGTANISWDLGFFKEDDITKLQMEILAFNRDYSIKMDKIFAIYPQGESEAEDFLYTPAEGDTVLMDNEYISMYASETFSESRYYVSPVYIYNKTGADIRVIGQWSVIGDCTCNVQFAVDVPAGTGIIDKILWSMEELAAKGITNPKGAGVHVVFGQLATGQAIFEENFKIK